MGDKKKSKKQLLEEVHLLRQEVIRLKNLHQGQPLPDILAGKPGAQIGELGDLLSQILFEADLAGRVLYSNMAGFEATGYTEDDLQKGIDLLSLFPKDEHQRVRGDIQKVLSGEEFYDHEYTVVRKDGTSFPAIIYSSPIIKDGQPMGIRGVAIDISEHVETETQLQVLSSVIEQSDSSIAIVDRQGRVEYANSVFLSRNNLDPHKVIGMPWRDFVSQQSSLRKQYQDIHDKVLVQGETWCGEVKDVSTEGGFTWREAKIFPIKDAKGKLVHTVYMSDDITHRKRAESALRESQQRLSLHVQQTPLGVIEWNLNFEVVAWNPAAEKIFGYTLKEALGRHASDIIVPVDVRPHVDKIWKALLKKKGGERSTNENITKDGETILCEWYNTPLVDDMGRVIGVASLVQDITAQRQAQQALKKSEAEYRQMFEFSPVGIVKLDTKGRFIDANRKLYEMIRGVPEEFVGKGFMELPHLTETSKKMIHDMFKRRMKGEIVPAYDIEFVSKQGEKIIGRIIATQLRNEEGEFIYELAIISDITEQQKAKEELRESEEKYRLLFESAIDAIFIMKGEVFVDCNWKTLDMFGCTLDQIINHTPWDFSPPRQPDGRESKKIGREKISAAQQGKSQFFEWVHCKYNGDLFDVEVSLNLLELKDEKYLIAIVRDITDRKLAEEELQKSEEKYRRMFELSPQAIVMLDENGTLLEANKKNYELFGSTRQEVVGRNFMDLPYLPEESKAKAIATFQQRIKGDSIIPYEIEILTKSGVTKIGRIAATLIRDPKGHIRRTLVMIDDVTDQRWMEKLTQEQRDLALSLSVATNLKEAFSRCVDTALAVSDMDSAGIYLRNQNSGNLEMVHHLGLSTLFVRSTKLYLSDDAYTRMVMKGKPIYTTYDNIVTPNTGAARKREGLRALAIIPIQYQEEVIACLNAASHVFEEISAPVRMALEIIAAQMGEVIYRLRVEEAIRLSEERYRTLQENIPIGIFRTTPSGKIISANPAMAEKFGYPSLAEFLTVSAKDFYLLPAQRKKMLTELRQMGEVKDLEVQLKRKDGSTFWGVLNIRAVLDRRGSISHMDGILKDITDRKSAELALKESEERYRLLIRNIPAVSWTTSQSGKTIFISPNVEKVYGFTAQQIYENGKKLWLDRIHPDDKSSVQKAFKQLFTSKIPFDIEYRIKRKDGQWIWIHDRADTYITRDKVKYAYGTFSDISERKRASETIIRAKQEWERTFDTVPELIFILDEKKIIRRLNRALSDRLGVDPSELVGRKCYEVFHGSSRTPSFCPNSRVKAEGREHSVEVHEKNLGGDFIITISPWYDEGGKMIGTVHTAVDISERKWSENLLKKQRDLARDLSRTSRLKEALSIFLKAAIDVSGLDAGGVYVLNDESGGLELIHASGVSTEFVQGVSTLDPGSPHARLILAGKPVYQNYSQLTKSMNDPIPEQEGLQAIAMLPVLYKTEVVASLNMASHSLDSISTSARHALETLAANMGEVIVRIRAEEKLQSAMDKLHALTSHLQEVREEERIQIARELHDELSSMLTVLKLGVVRISDQLMLKDTEEFAEIINKTRSMEEMINKSVTLVRKMITRLRPAILDDLGLIAAIEWLVEEFQEDSGIVCSLNSGVEQLDFETVQSTAIFRILQEVLTNVARHAQASKVTISIKRNDKHLVLQVRDNGQGIQPVDIGKKESFGIIGMRERASLFNWNFSIKGDMGRGTTVTLTIPMGGKTVE